MLTAQGVIVVEWAGRLLAAAEEMSAAIGALRTDRDRGLHISASMTVAEHLLPRWLVALAAQQGSGRRVGARTAVSLTATNSRQVIAAVTNGEAQLGFIEQPEAPSELSVLDIGTDELVLVAAPEDRWARRRRPQTPAEVAGRALTSREPGSGTRDVVERALARHGLSMAPPAVELTTSTGVREAVRSGGAPAFLSRRTVGADLDAGQVVLVRTTGLDLTRVLRAVWVGGTRPPAGPSRDLLAIACRPE